MKKFLLTFALILLSLTASADLKYVFLFIGDGMGMGHVMAAETYNRRVLGSPDNILMMQFPVSSFALLRQQLDNRLSGGWNGSCHRH